MTDLEYIREVDNCLSILDLQLYLDARILDDSINRHIRSCELCKRRLKNLNDKPISLKVSTIDALLKDLRIPQFEIQKKKPFPKSGQIWSLGNFENEMFHRLCIIQSTNSPRLFNYKTIQIIPISPHVDYATEKELIFQEAAEENPLHFSFMCIPRMSTIVLRKNLVNYFGSVPGEIVEILNQMTEEIEKSFSVSDVLGNKISKLKYARFGEPIISAYDIRRNFLQSQYLSLNELQRPIAELQNRADYFYALQESLRENFISTTIKWKEKGLEVISGIGNLIREPQMEYAIRDVSRKIVSKKMEIELSGRKIILSYFPKENQISLQIEIRDEIFPEKILDNVWIDVFKELEKIATLNPPETDTINIDKDHSYKFIFKYNKKEFGYYELNFKK